MTIETLHFRAIRGKALFWHFAANTYYTESTAWTFFNGIATLSTLPIAIGGHFLTGLANRLQKVEYTYWKGEGKEVKKRNWKVCHLNTCMFYGFLPHLYGGQKRATERIDDLIRFIKKENPDLIFMCEFNPSLSKRLYDKTKKKYLHYFVNIGPNALGIGASMCVISRISMTSMPQFIPTQVVAEKEQKLSYRGYFYIETPLAYFLYIHLHPKETQRAQEIRKEQMREIKTLTRDAKKPWVVLGDFNIDRFNGGSFKGFEDPLGTVETCREGESCESIDALLTKGKIRAEVFLRNTYDFTDHQAVIGKISCR